MPVAERDRVVNLRARIERSKVIAQAVADGVARLVDVSPDEFTVFTEESDWAFLGDDFRDAIDTLIANDERLQPHLPFEDEDALDEAK
jgi:hypothetical protein